MPSPFGPRLGAFVIDDQSDVIAYLSSPGAYGAAVTTVTRIDTQRYSLSGGRSSLQAEASGSALLSRLFDTGAEGEVLPELDLNRRTAPSLYLEVKPVTRSASGALSLDGAGVVVDWLVVMRRFDQEDLLDRRADQGL